MEMSLCDVSIVQTCTSASPPRSLLLTVCISLPLPYGMRLLKQMSNNTRPIIPIFCLMSVWMWSSSSLSA